MCQDIITHCVFIVVDEHVLCAVFVTFLMSMFPVFWRSRCDVKRNIKGYTNMTCGEILKIWCHACSFLFSCIVSDEGHVLTQYCDVTWTRGELTSPSIHSLPYRKYVIYAAIHVWYVVMFFVDLFCFLTCKTVHVRRFTAEVQVKWTNYIHMSKHPAKWLPHHLNT